MLKLERLRNHKFTKWPNWKIQLQTMQIYIPLLASCSLVAMLSFGKTVGNYEIKGSKFTHSDQDVWYAWKR